MPIKVENFGASPEGQPVKRFTLEPAKGLKAVLLSYGAILQYLEVPDQAGRSENVVLGFDRLEDYFTNTPYLGATVGRVANRIALGKFTLNGVVYRLATNNGRNHLHGGPKGLTHVVWDGRTVDQGDTCAVAFETTSPEGEEGYPGTLKIKVTYSLSPKGELKIAYEARSDRDTPVNLTHHSYFNFAGAGNGDILDHELKIHAERFTASDSELIPTGELPFVSGPLDFRKAKPIGRDIAAVPGGGYDLNYVLAQKKPGALTLAAEVWHPKSGRRMSLYTTEPGVQLYTGNFLGGIAGAGGKRYAKHTGFCLEAQHFPDAPNQPKFPSIILRPGQVYRQTTVHAFSA